MKGEQKQPYICSSRKKSKNNFICVVGGNYLPFLNPQVDDQELQDEPLQIRLMDHDTYSANDAIGKVYVDLNPLLLPPPSHPSSQRPHDPSQPGVCVYIFSYSVKVIYILLACQYHLP